MQIKKGKSFDLPSFFIISQYKHNTDLTPRP